MIVYLYITATSVNPFDIHFPHDTMFRSTISRFAPSIINLMAYNWKTIQKICHVDSKILSSSFIIFCKLGQTFLIVLYLYPTCHSHKNVPCVMIIPTTGDIRMDMWVHRFKGCHQVCFIHSFWPVLEFVM